MAAPVLAPKQSTLVVKVVVVIPEPGWVMVTVFVVVQLLASVTVTVLTPELSDDITEVVAPVDQR